MKQHKELVDLEALVKNNLNLLDMKTWGEKQEAKGISTASLGEGEKVESYGNRIFFYSEVEQSKILEMNKSLYSISSQNLARSIEFDQEPAAIKLHIKSYGGSVFAGLAGMDTINEIKERLPVITIVEGCAASAATFLSCVGTERHMRKNAHMLIHQLSSLVWGKYDEIKDEVDNLDRLMVTIKKIYKDYTKVPMKEIDAILKRDIWWDAETCKKYGLIDKII